MDIGDWAAALAAQSAPLFAAGVLMLAALAGTGIFFAMRYFRRARLIDDTPTATARGAALGHIELRGIGEAMEGPPTIAPLSGLACLWYRYRVEERSGDDLWSWRETGTSSDVFWLRDATGRVAVDPEGAEVTVRHRERWAGGVRGASPFIRASDDRYRYTEERLHTGEALYALGTLEALAPLPPTADVPARARELLREWKRDQSDLHARFDRNRDGRIDAHEWLEAEQAALTAAAAEPIPAFDASRDAPINILRRGSLSGRPFILSAYAPERLRFRYRAFALAATALGVAAAAFAATALQLR